MSSHSRATVGWAIVFILGAIGLIVNGLSRPHGFGKQYVRVEERRFYEVNVAAPIGADAGGATSTKWLPSTSSELEKPNVSRTSAEPVTWNSATLVTPVEYWASQSNGFKGPDGSTYAFSWRYTIGVWVAAFFTLAILSFLWGDNPVYRFAESVVVGTSAAYWMVVAFWSTLVPKLFQPLAPVTMQAWALPGTSGTRELPLVLTLVPVALSIMLLMRLSPRGGWIATWPLAFVVGTFAALRLIAHVQADFVAQVSNSVIPLIVFTEGKFDWGASVGNVVLITGLLAVITYFFFALEHKGVVGRVARVGVWFLMVAFGAAFAFTVMGRITLLSQRFEFLFDDWLWLIDPQHAHTFTQAATTIIGSS